MAVDGNLGSVVTQHGHDLEEIPSSVGSEVEHLPVLLVAGGKRVVNGVLDVCNINPMPECGGIDLHREENIVSRN